MVVDYNKDMKKLYRSNVNQTIYGVAGGLAEYFKIDVTVVRLLWIILILATGIFPGVILYFLMALVIPKKPADIVKKEEVAKPVTVREEGQI